MKILILYSELAGYTIACLDRLMQEPHMQVKLVRWPVNKEAPFEFDFGEGLEVFDRSTLSQAELDQIVKDFEPNGIFVSGWIDKGYLKALAYKPAATPVICGLDNQWRGDLRQRIGTLLSPWLVRKHFDYIWGAGPRQADYAAKLGYDSDHIRQGYYSADVPRFSTVQAPLENEPRTLLYVGRIMEHKGIGELIEAFCAQDEQLGWQLKLVGKADGSVAIPDDPRIIHQDFVQPEELPSLMAEATAFILPSREEPWGVALHEAAAVGLPLIASNACGSGDAFVEPERNGLIFRAKDRESLNQILQKLFSLDTPTLKAWGQHSRKLAQKITPETWTHTLLEMIEKR